MKKKFFDFKEKSIEAAHIAVSCMQHIAATGLSSSSFHFHHSDELGSVIPPPQLVFR